MKMKIIIFFLSLFFYNCAMNYNKALPGGEKDLTQPTAGDFVPETGRVNVKDNYSVSVSFSEYIDYASTRNALEVYPRGITYKAKWDERSLVVDFFDLPESTTVVTVLNRDLTDLRKNKLDRSYFYSFSTGNTIDSAKFSGYVNMPLRLNNLEPNCKNLKVSLFDYQTAEKAMKYNSLDSLDITAYSYQTTVNDSDFFTFKYLNKKKYLAIAFNDDNSNNLPDFHNSEFVSLSTYIDLVKRDHYYEEFTPGLYDNLPPFINEVKVTNKNQLDVEFSEDVKLETMSDPEIWAIDTNEKLKIKKSDFLPESKLVKLLLQDSLRSNDKYLLKYDVITDLSDNSQEIEDNRSYTFYTEELAVPDTFKIENKLASSIALDNTLVLKHNKFIYDSLKFSIWHNKKDSLLADLQDSTISKPFNYEVRFPQNLEPGKYRLLVNKLDKDTVYFNYLNLNEIIGTGTVSGVIKGAEKPLVNILAYDLSNKKTKVFYGKKKDFLFPLKPGKYLFAAYYDTDKNGFFSVKSEKSLNSEIAHFLQDTIVVKKNWESHGLKFEF